MKTISFELSDEAYNYLQRLAEAKEKSADEYILEHFKHFEIYKEDQAEQEKHIDTAKSTLVERKARAIYNKHPLQSYILEYFSDGKTVKKVVQWRTCPIQPSSRRDKEHVGEYFVSINTYKKRDLGPFRQIQTAKTFHRKKLKSLKRKINTIMGYEHYKVKQK